MGRDPKERFKVWVMWPHQWGRRAILTATFLKDEMWGLYWALRFSGRPDCTRTTLLAATKGNRP